MGVLLITCPVTGKEFSTGVEGDKTNLLQLRGVEGIAHCPYCKTDHTWRSQEARYVDAPPPDWVDDRLTG